MMFERSQEIVCLVSASKGWAGLHLICCRFLSNLLHSCALSSMIVPTFIADLVRDKCRSFLLPEQARLWRKT
jgi:hypothetical protein